MVEGVWGRSCIDERKSAPAPRMHLRSFTTLQETLLLSLPAETPLHFGSAGKCTLTGMHSPNCEFTSPSAKGCRSPRFDLQSPLDHPHTHLCQIGERPRVAG